MTTTTATIIIVIHLLLHRFIQSLAHNMIHKINEIRVWYCKHHNQTSSCIQKGELLYQGKDDPEVDISRYTTRFFFCDSGYPHPSIAILLIFEIRLSSTTKIQVLLFKTWFLLSRLSGLSGLLVFWSLALVLFGDLVLCCAVNRVFKTWSLLYRSKCKPAYIVDQHCYGPALLWTSIVMDQHCYGSAYIVDQHYYGPALLWTSIIMDQHCYGPALLWTSIVMDQHCYGPALLWTSIVMDQHL
ncbi:hypothetical protein BD560DRAFT_429836 [Blakeslea trispora]|nr:hypothetical protein BD560DRAFT_429836 [Blakeslea trispora]